MSQAIEVKHHMDNNGNGKYIAACAAKRKIFFKINLQQELKRQGREISIDEETALAAEKLRDELGWEEQWYGKMICGTLKNGNSVFVFTGREKSANNLAFKSALREADSVDNEDLQAAADFFDRLKEKPDDQKRLSAEAVENNVSVNRDNVGNLDTERGGSAKSGAASHVEVLAGRVPDR